MPTVAAAPRPDFIVIGFSKCASTSLCAMLGEHPEICMSEPKETNYYLWANDRGPAWYQSCFAGFQPGQLQGDGSVFYASTACEQQAAPRILAAKPDVKLIWIARHPIKRLESSYREAHHSGHIYGEEPPYFIADFLAKHPFALDDNRYFCRLRHYLDLFPPEQFHVLLLEDLVADRAGELARIHTFLGVTPVPHAVAADDCWLNSGSEKFYDSKLLRLARQAPGVRRLVLKAGGHRVDAFGRRTGLRRPFRGPIHWRPGERERVLDELRDDCLGLLRCAGKPDDAWDLGASAPSLQRAA